MRNKCDIYISYSQADYETARKIVGVIQRQGYPCFVDYLNLDSGKFDEQIFEAINSSKCFLLLYSQHVESSQFIRREVESALENGIKILPILLSEFEVVSWYKDRFSQINYIRICDGVLSLEVIEQLLHGVNCILGESEKKSSIGFSSESMPNCAPSSSNNTEDVDYCPNHAPNRKVYSKRSKLGCLILFAILFAIIGFGIFFSTWFVGSHSPSSSHEEIECCDSCLVYDDYDELEFCDTIACDSVEHLTNREQADAPPTVLDSVNTQDNGDNQSMAHRGIVCSRNRQSFKTELFFVFVILTFFVLCGFVIYKYRHAKRKNVKITCNKSAIIHVDGNPVAELEAHKVHTIHLDKGKFIVDFQLISDKSKHETMPVNINKVTEDIIVEGKFHSLLNEKSTIKVFIAGSTRLVAERDALRSVIGQMYNKYKEDNLLIEAYSFDDFPREFTEGGHQKLYDEFIRKEANWVVFITDGEIGEKTIWELGNAIKAYKSGKRPKILMYSKPEKTQSSLQMTSFRRLLFEENQYWIDYTSLNDIKTSFRDHLQWDLYNLMKSQYKKIS